MNSVLLLICSMLCTVGFSFPSLSSIFLRRELQTVNRVRKLFHNKLDTSALSANNDEAKSAEKTDIAKNAPPQIANQRAQPYDVMTLSRFMIEATRNHPDHADLESLVEKYSNCL
jgi:hypothetical protein